MTVASGVSEFMTLIPRKGVNFAIPPHTRTRTVFSASVPILLAVACILKTSNTICLLKILLNSSFCSNYVSIFWDKTRKRYEHSRPHNSAATCSIRKAAKRGLGPSCAPTIHSIPLIKFHFIMENIDVAARRPPPSVCPTRD